MERMRIGCPSCAAEYDVPDRLLAGTARTLRCSRCGADFTLPGAAASPQAPAPAAEDAPTAAPPDESPMPAPEPRPVPTAATVPEPTPTARLRDRPVALRRAWVASIALVVGAALSVLVFRTTVMEAWPPAIRLFTALGLA